MPRVGEILTTLATTARLSVIRDLFRCLGRQIHITAIHQAFGLGTSHADVRSRGVHC